MSWRLRRPIPSWPYRLAHSRTSHSPYTPLYPPIPPYSPYTQYTALICSKACCCCCTRAGVLGTIVRCGRRTQITGCGIGSRHRLSLDRCVAKKARLKRRAGRGAAFRHPLDEPPPRGPLPSRKEEHAMQGDERARGDGSASGVHGDGLTQGWGPGHAQSAQ